MEIKEKLKSFDKKSSLYKEINSEMKILPDNTSIVEELLKMVENNHTKLVLDSEIKNSYYVFFNDTIYLSNKESARDDPERVVLISHEIKHSIQSKILQVINFLFSNVELIAFIISIVLIILNKMNIRYIYCYIILMLFSIIPRLILEFDAIISSIKMTRKYLSEKLNFKLINKIMDVFQFKIKCMLPLFIINLFLGRIIRLILVYFMYFFYN